MKSSPSTSSTETLSSLNNQPRPRNRSLSTNLVAFLSCLAVIPSVSFSAFQIVTPFQLVFGANQFVGAGIRPIYRLSQMFHLRGEFYGFMPIYPIEKNSLNKAYYGKAFSKFEYWGEISVVCQLPFGDISAYVNHYSSPKREWNVGLSIGLQLFNYRFIE